jgi:hypothetical protein
VRPAQQQAPPLRLEVLLMKKLVAGADAIEQVIAFAALSSSGVQ